MTTMWRALKFVSVFGLDMDNEIEAVEVASQSAGSAIAQGIALSISRTSSIDRVFMGGEQVAFRTWQQAMGERAADTAAIKIHHATLLPTGEDDAPTESVPTLVVDQPCPQQQIEAIAQTGQMTAQIAARSVAHAQFFHEVRIMQASLPQILSGFWVAVELRLVKGGGLLQQLVVSGESDVETSALVQRAKKFATAFSGEVRVTPITQGRRTKRWGMCTGAGASSNTLKEAGRMQIDTLIVGEGPHHTAVQAEESGLAIIYAGHYATETLGVRALAEHLGEKYGIPANFVSAPTGL